MTSWSTGTDMGSVHVHWRDEAIYDRNTLATHDVVYLAGTGARLNDDHSLPVSTF